MMITFLRQIKTVGWHWALIRRVADRAQTTETQQAVLDFMKVVRRGRKRPGYRQTHKRTHAHSLRQTLRAEATPSALCIQKQWDPGRAAGTQTDIVELFISNQAAQTAPRRPPASLRWLLFKLSGYHKHVLPLTYPVRNKRVSSSLRHILIRVPGLSVNLQPAADPAISWTPVLADKKRKYSLL